MLQSTLIAAQMLLAISVSGNEAGFELNGWRGGPILSDQRFERCEMRFDDNGNQLVVTLTQEGDVGVGLGRSRRREGERAMLTYRTDKGTMARAPAQYLDEDVIAWFDGPDYARHLLGIIRSERVTLKWNGQRISFNLPRGEAPAIALTECVQHFLDRESARASTLIEMFRLR